MMKKFFIGLSVVSLLGLSRMYCKSEYQKDIIEAQQDSIEVLNKRIFEYRGYLQKCLIKIDGLNGQLKALNTENDKLKELLEKKEKELLFMVGKQYDYLKTIQDLTKALADCQNDKEAFSHGNTGDYFDDILSQTFVSNRNTNKEKNDDDENRKKGFFGKIIQGISDFLYSVFVE